jgi:hypothetical protein
LISKYGTVGGCLGTFLPGQFNSTVDKEKNGIHMEERASAHL